MTKKLFCLALHRMLRYPWIGFKHRKENIKQSVQAENHLILDSMVKYAHEQHCRLQNKLYRLVQLVGIGEEKKL